MGTQGEFKVAVTKEDLVFASAHFITLAGHRCESLHAGAGIVWDSEPAAEYQETLAKARTMIESLTSPRKTPRTHGPAHHQA